MLGSLIAVNNPFPFSISGFGGLTTAQIISFFIDFVLFNVYVVLMVIAMVGFYFTSKPRHGVDPHGRHLALLRRDLDAHGLHRDGLGRPRREDLAHPQLPVQLGVSQRGINAFISLGFAFIAVVCMVIGFAGASRQNRAIREKVLAAV